jgi:hypothetical protein
MGGASIPLVSRLREFLKEAGRSDEKFGLECMMLHAQTPDSVAEMALRWRDIGGTHLSLTTMGQNFTTVDQHLDFIKRAADALRKAGL